MKKTTRFIILLLLVLLIGGQSVSAELADEDVADAVEIIRLINEYRAGQGLNPYTFDQTLAVTAQLHSEYQAANNISTHKGADGSSSTDRARAQGYNGDVSYFRTDEMIYNGSFANPQTAFTWWKGSPIHNGIMTSDVYHQVGVGIALSEEGRIYYTVNVGMIPNVTSPGSMDYRAPSVEEYKAGAVESIPIVTETSGTDGSIYHTFKTGETLAAIAEAYGVSENEIRTLNSLPGISVPGDGQLLLISPPTSAPAAATSTPVPTDPPQEAVIPPVSDSPGDREGEQPTVEIPLEGDGASPGSEGPTVNQADPVDPGTTASSGRNLIWVWLFLGVVVLAAAGAGLYWYLPKLRQTAKEEGYDLEKWLMDDLRKEEEAGDEDHLQDHDTTTREFDHLPRKSQVALLQDAARQALEAYPIQVEGMELLRYILNAEFVVHARADGVPGELRKYVLRVNAPNFHTRAEIASEMGWLDALTKETRLTVPVPVKTRSNRWVTTVDHPGLGTWRHCVLFEYLPAATSQAEITPSRIELLGALIGLLHKHSASFNPPPGFIRPHWDLEGMRGEMLDVPITQAYADLTSEERHVLDEAQEIVAEATDRLGSGPRVYGLIHGDLHLKSMLFSPAGHPVVIDFDTCGYGYYVYDLAVAVWNIFDRDDFTVLRDALLGGYRKVRPLSDLEETFMIHFVAGRLMIQILTWAPRRADPNLEAAAEKAIAKQVKQLKALLRILKG